MRTLTQLYQPITGTPFQADASYREVAPCAALSPYIRCFWGSERPLPDTPTPGGIVIPDTCMDIIFRIDHAANCISSTFCTLDEHASFSAPSGHTGGLSSTFGIRFYAWTACLFAEAPLHGHLNGRCPTAMFFPRLERALTPVILREPTLTERIRSAEALLLTLLHSDATDAAVLNAVHHMLRTEGRCRMADVSAALAYSPRQLERRFDAALGVPPKTFASLMRYQLLWQSMVLSPHFDPLDAVDRFGYTDQAHMLHDFRRHHLMTPREALALARQ